MGSILTADGFINTFHLSSSLEGLITAIFQLGSLLGPADTCPRRNRSSLRRCRAAGIEF